MADGRVIIDIDGDDKNFLKELSGLGSKVDKELGGLQSSLSKTGGALTKYVTAPLLVAGAAVIAFGVKSAASFEQTAISFETMLGSAKAGKQMFDQLKKFAAETPFELPGILDSAKKLLAFGFAAQDVVPMLRSVGDAAAGLGLGTEGMERVITAMGQMKAKGKVSAEEMLQLAESGIPAWEALATKIGVDIPTAMKMAEKGAIKAETGIEALTEMMDKKFGGMMLKQATSLSGLWSTLKDVFSIKLGEGFQKNLEPLKETLTDLIDTAGPLVDALIPAFIAVLEAAMPVIEDVAGALRSFADASPETQKAILNIVAAAALLGPVIQGATGAMHLFTGAAKVLGGTGLAAGIGNLGAAFALVSTNMGASVATLATMGGAVAAVSAGYVALAGAAGYAIGSLINQIPAVAEKQREWGEALGGFIYQQKAEQIATDETVAKWKTLGIELDENNNLTELGVAQLRAHADAHQRNAAATDTTTAATGRATAATYEYRDSLIAMRNEQMGAERADIALEQSKNRLEDAQLAYTEAVKEHGPASREAEDALLNLRTANLDVEDATNRVTAAQDTLNKKLESIPKPAPGDMQAWMTYYQQIGDKASYAAAQAAAANAALHGNKRQGGSGTWQIPEYGTGADLRATGSHLAVVGDSSELIFPMGDSWFAEKYLPILLASLPRPRGSFGSAGSVTSVARGGDTIIQQVIVDGSKMPSADFDGLIASIQMAKRMNGGR